MIPSDGTGDRGASVTTELVEALRGPASFAWDIARTNFRELVKKNDGRRASKQLTFRDVAPTYGAVYGSFVACANVLPEVEAILGVPKDMVFQTLAEVVTSNPITWLNIEIPPRPNLAIDACRFSYQALWGATSKDQTSGNLNLTEACVPIDGSVGTTVVLGGVLVWPNVLIAVRDFAGTLGTEQQIKRLAAEQSARSAVAPGPPTSESTSNLADQIRELGKLRDEGLISEAEFAQQKARILAS